MRTYTSGVEGQMCLDLERPSGEGGKRSANEMQIKIESPGLSSEYPEYSEEWIQKKANTKTAKLQNTEHKTAEQQNSEITKQRHTK